MASTRPAPSPTPAMLLVLLALALAQPAYASLPLPDYVLPCSIKLSDRKFSQCCTEHAREIFPHVMKGDPKYNVPVLDPLTLEKLDVITGEGPMGLQLSTSDVKLYGLPELIVNNILHQSAPLQDTFVVTIPELRVTAKYNASGRILLLPIQGVGNLRIKFKNMKITYQYDVKLEKVEDGEVYYKPQPGARLDADCEGMEFYLDNLFNGNKALEENTNKLLNEEWRDVFASLKPAVTKAMSDVITNILNGIFTQVKYKDAFLDTE